MTNSYGAYVSCNTAVATTNIGCALMSSSDRFAYLQVLMATNRIDILDAALLRPGRIDRKIEFPNPNEGSRFDILKIHSRKMNLMRGIDLKKVADKMPVRLVNTFTKLR